MVKHQEPELDGVLAAIADPARRSIVTRLAEGPASVSQLAEPLTMSLPGVMKHVRVLEQAGLLTHHKEGRTRWCALRPEPLAAVDDWLERYRRFWDGQLDGLVDHFSS
ncbi:MAG: ArsR/SmtB family transcription factor [Solirubrobacteraceae bacterium]